MSKQSGSRKIGNNKASASNVAYKMQDRRSKNAKRKALKEQKREADDHKKSFRRRELRAIGALSARYRRAIGALRRLKLRPKVSPELMARVQESVNQASY